MTAPASPGGAGPRLLIDEHIRADSRVLRTYLVPVAGDKVAIEVGLDGEPPAAIAALTAASVAHVLRHYGRPLADEVLADLDGAERLALGPGLAVARLHWRAAVDAAGRDWLVLVADGAEPVAALAPGVAGALRFIASGRAP